LNAGPPPIGGFTLDFNADGCRDSASGTTVYIAGCNGTTATTVSLAAEVKGVAHWDGDRRSDILVLPSGSSTLKVQVSNGNAVGSLLETNMSAAALCQVFATDANGDGLDEVGCNNYITGLTLYNHNGPLITPDLATSFTDGFGVNATVAYSPLAAPVYTPYLDAAYPQRDIFRVLQDGGGIQVVASASASDGANGAYTTTYAYYGATEDLLGRGFQAFDKIQATDSRNGMYRIDYYERAFPKTGQIRQTELFQSGGTLVSRQTVTAFGQLTWDTGFNQRLLAYPQTTTGVQHEVGGTANGTQILQATGSTTLDTFGNVTSATSTVTDTDPLSLQLGQSWTQTTSMTYTGDTSGNWCLGLPTSQSVTYSASNGEASVTRSQTMSADNTLCRPTGSVVEPSSSTRKVVTGLGFDGFGNVSSVSVTGQTSAGLAMAPRPSSAGFGTTGQFPLSSTVSPASGVSWTTARTFDSLTGQVATETDANGVLVLANTFDSFGRIQRSTQADSTSTYYTYANCATYGCENGDKLSGNIGVNKLIVIASYRDSTDTQIRADWTYLDQFDRPIVQKAMTLSGTYSRSGRQYDAFGRVQRETAPCEEGGCASAQYWITNGFDLIGRVTSQTRPRSETDSTLVTTIVAHAGRAQTVTDAEGKVSTKLMDVRGLMRRSQDHNGYYQAFGYDAFGSLKSVGDSLGNTLFSANYSYGVQAFQDSTTDMDLGAWSYAYNSLGERTAWTDAKSQSFSMTFDWLSRPLVRTEPSQTTTWTWGSNAANKNIGRLATLNSSTPVYTETYTYDSIGRLVTKLINQASANYTYNYAYNSAGQLDLLTFPTSTSSTRVKLKNGYQYGLLKTVTDWTTGSAGTIYWQATTQNARGQVTTDQLGNGLVRNRAFDAVTGWQSNALAGVGGGAGVMNQAYAYDKVGNVTQRQDNNAGLTESFYYDNLHRLDYSQLNGVTNLDVGYDDMGNITSRSDVASGTTWAYDSAKKHAVKTAGAANAYLYDANGNMTSRAGSSITWTSYNYPTSMSVPGGTATIQYGPNRQYLQTVMPHPAGGNTETIRYIGEAMERRARGTEVDWRHFVRVGSETVAIISRKSTGTNAVRYVLGDHQGSTAVLTSNTGSVLLNESYAAFGAPRSGTTWSGTVSTADQTTMADISRHGYTDHTMLGFGGLIHMNGRVQDSITGRFLSPDPHTSEPGHTQGYNRYAYVRNNPLSYSDPTGLDLGDLLQWLCNNSTGMCPAIAVPWELAEVTVQAQRYVQDALMDVQEYLRQQRENSSTAQAAGDSGGGGGGGASEPPQSPTPTVCSSPLPGGRTIGDNIRELRRFYDAQMNLARYTRNPTPGGAYLATVGYWLGKVGPGGDWANNLGEPSGNWNYGATGRAIGLPLELLQRGAGAAEMLEGVTGRTGGPDTGIGVPWGGPPYGDNPEGFAQVTEGFNANCH
jgi:RHS repeat-associated protein